MSVTENIWALVDRVKSFWATFDVKQWAQGIGGSSAEAIEAAVYFALSFSIGFLFKKYCKFVVVCLVVTACLIKIGEYNQFLTIDWAAIKTCLGLTPDTDLNTLMNHGCDWIKNNVVLFVAIIIGFLVGYKLG